MKHLIGIVPRRFELSRCMRFFVCLDKMVSLKLSKLLSWQLMEDSSCAGGKDTRLKDFQPCEGRSPGR